MSETPWPSRPFTPMQAARQGIGRAGLERAVREGRLRRILRGVYLDASVTENATVRAEALTLVIGTSRIATGRTAAWVHAGPAAVLGPLPPSGPDLIRPRGTRARGLGEADVSVIAGLACTSKLRTALDLGGSLPAEAALAVLDGLLRAGLSATALHEAAVREPAVVEGSGRLDLIAMADPRARDAAESVLRLRWYLARVPTPTPGVRAGTHRCALGLPAHRFAVAFTDRIDPEAVGAASAAGWRVLALDRGRVLGAAPAAVVAHLEREFHQHLLAQVEQAAAGGAPGAEEPTQPSEAIASAIDKVR